MWVIYVLATGITMFFIVKTLIAAKIADKVMEWGRGEKTTSSFILCFLCLPLGLLYVLRIRKSKKARKCSSDKSKSDILS